MFHNDLLHSPIRLKTVITQAASWLELFIGGGAEEAAREGEEFWQKS